MASDSTDALFGFILFILFLALLGYAAGGAGWSPSTAGTTGGTSRSLPPLAGSEMVECPADEFDFEQEKTDETTAVNLKVYVDPTDAGRKCATASTTSAGTLKVTLAYTADKTQMVSDTSSCQSSGRGCTASVEVSGTDDYCVSAVAERSGTAKVTIPKVVEPCMMRVPATEPDRPIRDLPAHDIEDEEGK